ncbi:MAG: hypothetical protein Kow00127_21480 [Bacteroidales bacterium]
MELIPNFTGPLPEIIWDLLDSFDFPTTVVYDGARNLAPGIIASDGSVAIRIIRSGFCHELIKACGVPLVSTSANFTGETAPVLFRDISPDLLNKVDYVVDYGRENIAEVKPSTIIRLKPDGQFDIIRD